MADSINFESKTWVDAESTGTAITSQELNRIENALKSLTSAVNALQDEVYRYKIYTGSRTCTNWVGQEVCLFLDSEFQSMFGRRYDPSKDYIGVACADNDSYDKSLYTIKYYPQSSHNIFVATSSVDNKNVDISYFLALAKF